MISCASDSKWRRIFEELQEASRASTVLTNDRSRIKLLGSKDPSDYPNLLASLFKESFLDGASGPVFYRDVEWIEICAGDLQPEFECQVDFENRDGFIRIYGYRRARAKEV